MPPCGQVVGHLQTANRLEAAQRSLKFLPLSGYMWARPCHASWPLSCCLEAVHPPPPFSPQRNFTMALIKIKDCWQITLNCTLPFTQWKFHTAHLTPHTAQWTVHTAYCLVHTTHCSLHTAHCSLHTAHWTRITRCTRCTRCTRPLKDHQKRCTGCSAFQFLVINLWSIQTKNALVKMYYKSLQGNRTEDHRCLYFCLFPTQDKGVRLCYVSSFPG